MSARFPRVCPAKFHAPNSKCAPPRQAVLESLASSVVYVLGVQTKPPDQDFPAAQSSVQLRLATPPNSLANRSSVHPLPTPPPPAANDATPWCNRSPEPFRATTKSLPAPPARQMPDSLAAPIRRTRYRTIVPLPRLPQFAPSSTQSSLVQSA